MEFTFMGALWARRNWSNLFRGKISIGDDGTITGEYRDSYHRDLKLEGAAKGRTLTITTTDRDGVTYTCTLKSGKDPTGMTKCWCGSWGPYPGRLPKVSVYVMFLPATDVTEQSIQRQPS